MSRLNDFGAVTAGAVAGAAEAHGAPFYLYDERLIREKCRELLRMPEAYGLTVRYAMKANSTRALLRVIADEGLRFDASSVNEVRRARMAGIEYAHIILTTQEVPSGEDAEALRRMMREGLKYNVCSLRQLREIGGFAAEQRIPLAMRIHPGVGAGESATRNTGDNASCFGVHLSDLGEALAYAREKRITFDHMHVHIGSGGKPQAWRDNIDLELELLGRHFPDAETISFGGGLKEARMPDETAADVAALGRYAKEKLEQFCAETGRKLAAEIEPGTYVVANSGYAVTEVIDKKRTGPDGFNFVVAGGGMELNARPLLYASRHPFYVVSRGGALLSSEFRPESLGGYRAVLVGRCCESGDSQSLDADGLSVPRTMAEPDIGDYVVIGGVGAYCSSMAPFNYNSHVQIPELLLTEEGGIKEIRRRQTLEQIVENEL